MSFSKIGRIGDTDNFETELGTRVNDSFVSIKCIQLTYL